MIHPAISTEELSYRKRIAVLGTTMAYVDAGEGDPIVFLHGNPTPSYLWRNIIPYLLPFGRCLAPDWEGIVRPFRSWDEWPDATRAFFQAQRTAAGKDLILDKNLFIEYLLPLRNIAAETMEVYRRHYRNPGPSRLPMLAWTRDLPIAGEPQDVVAVVDSYGRWLSESPLPKLFIDAEPAGFLIGAQREYCRTWPNQQIVKVQGAHFVQEDSPQAVGEATARFVAKVLAGQIPQYSP